MPLKSESNHGMFGEKDIGRNLCLVRTLSVPQLLKPCWQLPPLLRIQAAFGQCCMLPQNFLGINVHMDLLNAGFDSVILERGLQFCIMKILPGDNKSASWYQ